jgi:hypothetical protein
MPPQPTRRRRPGQPTPGHDIGDQPRSLDELMHEPM